MCPQTQSPSLAPGAGTAKSPSAGGGVSHDIYQQDGDYIKDIEVNDLRNRYTLTKGSTQKMVNTPLVHEPTDTHRHSLLLPAFRVLWVCHMLLRNTRSLLLALQPPAARMPVTS